MAVWRIALWVCAFAALVLCGDTEMAIAYRQDPAVINTLIAREVPAALPQLDLLPKDQRQALLCIATAVFHEARGEPKATQELVARVAVNRMRERGLDGCAVVYQAGQFSWSTKSPTAIVQPMIAEPLAWTLAQRAAYAVLLQGAQDGARFNHFLNASVARPAWMHRGREYLRSGRLTFLTIPVR